MLVRAVAGVIVQTGLVAPTHPAEPAGILKLIVSAPASALASSIAARSVQTAPAVAQTPLPGVASPASPVELTVKAAADVGEAGAVASTSATNAKARTKS